MLVAVALLPAIALQAYNEFDRRRARQLEVQDHALSLAKLAAADQQQIVQGIRQVLIALSELPSIKSRDSLGCTTYLDAIKQRFPAFITLIVTDLKGLSFATPAAIISRLTFPSAPISRARSRPVHSRSENSR
ncbi:hypothetical protein [Bradyrhizobium barranii]